MESSPVGGGAVAARVFQHYLDRAAPHMAGPWAGTLVAVAVYLLIGILSPMVDPELDADPVLPTSGSDEFKPFIRRLPEFKFC